ncbi:MAG: winged helix-turn-helix domain-containing protein [Candidatus Saliniplasma sp.]
MNGLEILGSKTRLKILHLLSERDMYVSELMEKAGMDGKTAKHHLDMLERSGIVSSEERGRRKYYILKKEIILRISPSPNRRYLVQFQDI